MNKNQNDRLLSLLEYNITQSESNMKKALDAILSISSNNTLVQSRMLDIITRQNDNDNGNIRDIHERLDILEDASKDEVIYSIPMPFDNKNNQIPTYGKNNGKETENPITIDFDMDSKSGGTEGITSNPFINILCGMLGGSKKPNEDRIINSDDDSDADIDDDICIFTTKKDIDDIGTYDENYVPMECSIKSINDLLTLEKKLKDDDDDDDNEIESSSGEDDNSEIENDSDNESCASTVDITRIISKKKKEHNQRSIEKVYDQKKINKDKEISDTTYDKDKNLYKYKGKLYPINPTKLKNLVKPLTKLKHMIGLDSVKDSIIDFITHYLQRNDHDQMLHTVIEGPPGVGKTKLGKILAELYSALGVIPSSRCVIVKRQDLIGEHLGETTPKTQKKIDEAEGGVLFIDEAYSLGSEGKDIYSKECINCINQNLTEKKKKLIVIIAGYKDTLNKTFFSQNPGLERRFPFRHEIKGYNPTEMKDIFINMLKKKKLKLDHTVNNKILLKIFENEKNSFMNYGGDLENIVSKCEMINDRDRFGCDPNLRNILSLNIIKRGINQHKKMSNNAENTNYQHLYM